MDSYGLKNIQRKVRELGLAPVANPIVSEKSVTSDWPESPWARIGAPPPTEKSLASDWRPPAASRYPAQFIFVCLTTYDTCDGQARHHFGKMDVWIRWKIFMHKCVANMHKRFRTAVPKVTLTHDTQIFQNPRQGHQFGPFHFHSGS